MLGDISYNKATRFEGNSRVNKVFISYLRFLSSEVEAEIVSVSVIFIFLFFFGFAG